MSASISIRINQELYDQAKQDAEIEHRSISGQIEFWATLGRAAIDNPDLPINFIAESLASMREPREQAHASVFEYIEVFYNRKRRHSASGMMSPANFETFRKVA